MWAQWGWRDRQPLERERLPAAPSAPAAPSTCNSHSLRPSGCGSGEAPSDLPAGSSLPVASGPLRTGVGAVTGRLPP